MSEYQATCRPLSLSKNYLLFSIIFLICFCNTSASELPKHFVTDFGAVADGKTLNTEAIQNAIDAAHKLKGGIVVFTEGKFLSGSLVLKSDVRLLFEKGSVLLGSTHPGHYRRLEIKNALTSPKTDDNSKLALLVAYNANNISITGKGTIDGQGRQLALNIDSLHHTGIVIDPNYGTRPSELMRPKIINFWECKNVIVSGITIKNSSNWVQTYELCENVTVKNIVVKSRAYWNNDGLNITDSKHVKISNCDINSADDGITLKSYYPGRFNDDVRISNCTIRSSASAVKFGTASVGGFKDIVIDSISVFDTFRSAIAIETVDGGFIENVAVSNIYAENTGNAIFVRLGHRSGDTPGTIKGLSFKNIKAQIPFGRPDIDYDLRGPEVCYFHNQFPASIAGIPGSDVKGISLENIEITYPGRASKGMAYIPLWRLDDVPEKIESYPEYTMFGELPSWGFFIRHVKGISLKNVKLNLQDTDFRPAFVFDDVKDLTIEQLSLPDNVIHPVILKEIKNARIDNEARKYVKEL
ncbi:glycoside hydrolase family 28 protein [Fulvivirga sp. M361]|uniref:glycoside hydrolase family 28 protein n=1 Tax=Fulvivirga sp. M361 TaxID=2594266 RepID=UPI00117BD8C5|nr:glycosyl hydrolase family 28 protein [Fulvivirga sp. M361]TRX48705.1 glycoside hydrolase family 28 protein [Fulvivirga sp. M361]